MDAETATFCSRKSHRKTRTGCSGCKKRKVKCDEQKPDCRNCIKHAMRCHYSHIRRKSISSVHSPVSLQLLGLDPLQLNILDLELLHNYSTSTAYTLSGNAVLRNLWRINVVQLAFSYGFVMRGILALSALHLAYQNPQRRNFYLSQAVMHHQTALRTAIGLLTQVTDENCAALWIFSALTSFFAMASPRNPGDFLQVGEGGIAEWLFVFQGVRLITESFQAILERGILSPMFKHRELDWASQDSMAENEAKDHLTPLRHRIAATVFDLEAVSVYLESIDQLDKSYTILYAASAPKDIPYEVLITWLYHLSPEYLLHLRDHTQEALAIFAYGCVMLKKLDFCWWMEGWSIHLVSRIWFSLDDEHRAWIEWPVTEIGWFPDQDELRIAR